MNYVSIPELLALRPGEFGYNDFTLSRESKQAHALIVEVASSVDFSDIAELLTLNCFALLFQTGSCTDKRVEVIDRLTDDAGPSSPTITTPTLARSAWRGRCGPPASKVWRRRSS